MDVLRSGENNFSFLLDFFLPGFGMGPRLRERSCLATGPILGMRVHTTQIILVLLDVPTS